MKKPKCKLVDKLYKAKKKINKLKKTKESKVKKKENKNKKKKKPAPKSGKIEKVLHEFKEGELHSGSKKGPKVTNRKQAIAIALSEARRSRKSSKRKK